MFLLKNTHWIFSIKTIFIWLKGQYVKTLKKVPTEREEISFDISALVSCWIHIFKQLNYFHLVTKSHTFAGLVVLKAVRVQKNTTVALELFSLWRCSQLSRTGLWQSPLLFTWSPAEQSRGIQCQLSYPRWAIFHPRANVIIIITYI